MVFLAALRVQKRHVMGNRYCMLHPAYRYITHNTQNRLKCLISPIDRGEGLHDSP